MQQRHMAPRVEIYGFRKQEGGKIETSSQTSGTLKELTHLHQRRKKAVREQVKKSKDRMGGGEIWGRIFSEDDILRNIGC